MDLLKQFHVMQSKEKTRRNTIHDQMEEAPPSLGEKELRKRESVLSYMQEITERFSLHSTTCFTAMK